MYCSIQIYLRGTGKYPCAFRFYCNLIIQVEEFACTQVVAPLQVVPGLKFDTTNEYYLISVNFKMITTYLFQVWIEKNLKRNWSVIRIR